MSPVKRTGGECGRGQLCDLHCGDGMSDNHSDEQGPPPKQISVPSKFNSPVSVNMAHLRTGDDIHRPGGRVDMTKTAKTHATSATFFLKTWGRSGIDARHSHGFARCKTKSVVCTPRLAVSGCVHRTLRKCSDTECTNHYTTESCPRPSSAMTRREPSQVTPAPEALSDPSQNNPLPGHVHFKSARKRRLHHVPASRSLVSSLSRLGRVLFGAAGALPRPTQLGSPVGFARREFINPWRAKLLQA
ncbi:hypothetical protein Bbelb_153970 [Branchiostoma belcheri]|nr:hypothetical protein Bbelb_153970 [Branchiostoma belcheri]